ncbi:hypothetical protein Srubr_68140 [Streptomyces rubradiris]|uniref:Uncharacterized protein n=1 Tax=Streptomyces rubradiris TaxID=285531 RepID=A0ABQ3RM75_STRRR|nr:hypothetical protein GCM10018792_20940 [Streptomyces rubradiris]GHI56968.1 hypothetical protein Srubr_68140 [Streptomyces rubradiris]
MPVDTDPVAGRCGMFVPAERALGSLWFNPPVLGVPGPGGRLDQGHGKGPVKAPRSALLKAIPT